MASTPLKISLSVDDMPEVVARLRNELAKILTEHASEAGDAGKTDLEAELIQIAATFEAGQ